MSDDPYWSAEAPGGPSGRFGGDALVTDTFASWWRATSTVVARSWRSMGLVLLVGAVLPRWLLGAYWLLASPGEAAEGGGWRTAVDRWPPGPPTAAVGLLLGLTLLYLGAVAALAATRTAAAEAAGGFLSLGEAFAFGFERGWRLWLWLLPAWATVAAGLAAFALPGLWAAFTLGLMVPVATFERRRSPYTRSMGLARSPFWAASGRLAVVTAVALAANLAVGALGAALAGLWRTAFEGWSAAVLTVAAEAVMSLLLVAPTIWVLSAALCTYAWLRGRREPLSATSLSAEAAERVDAWGAGGRQGRHHLFLAPDWHSRPESAIPDLALSDREC